MHHVEAVGGTTDSLVIQITMWREDETFRARLWSGVDDGTSVTAARSEDEVIALVRDAIQRWMRSGGS